MWMRLRRRRRIETRLPGGMISGALSPTLKTNIALAFVPSSEGEAVNELRLRSAWWFLGVQPDRFHGIETFRCISASKNKMSPVS